MFEDPQLIKLVENILLILSYGLLGAMIKYIDQAFDFGVFSRKIAVFGAMPAGLLMGALIVGDSSSATILLAVVLAVAFAKKIDNIAFKLGAASLLILPIFYRSMVSVEWLPLILLVAAGIVDELGNDWIDWLRKRRALSETLRKPARDLTSLSKTIEEIFTNRGTMKLAIIALAILGVFSPIYLVAFLAFDATYILTEKISFTDIQQRLKTAGRNRKTPFKAKNTLTTLKT